MRKKLVKLLIAAVILFFVTGLYIYYQYNRKNAAITSISPDYKLSAHDIIKAFESDETTANKRYLDKVLQVTGTIRSVNVDDSGLLTLVIGDTSSRSSVRCIITNLDKVDPKQLVVADPIMIKGFCTGYTSDDLGLGSDVILNRCVVSNSINK